MGTESKSRSERALADEIEAQFMAHQPPASYPSEWIFSVKMDFRDWHAVVKALRGVRSEQRDSDTKNSINADKYAGNGMGAWDNDALSDMARAVCRVFPKVGSMETAHKVVAAVVRAQEQFERNLR